MQVARGCLIFALVGAYFAHFVDFFGVAFRRKNEWPSKVCLKDKFYTASDFLTKSNILNLVA